LVQWLLTSVDGNDGSISRIVPTPLSMQAVYTPLPSGIVAYATPPAAARTRSDSASSRANRRLNGTLIGDFFHLAASIYPGPFSIAYRLCTEGRVETARSVELGAQLEPAPKRSLSAVLIGQGAADRLGPVIEAKRHERCPGVSIG
jgi:hypothetical protein